MSKTAPGPKELALRAQREAKASRPQSLDKTMRGLVTAAEARGRIKGDVDRIVAAKKKAKRTK